MDFGFHGPKFTWTNKNLIWHRNIEEILDIGLNNTEWKLLFPRLEIHHLSRTKFDHCSILLDSEPPTCKLIKPFKFKQIWLTDPSSSTLVRNSWNSSAFIPSSSSFLSRFQNRLKILTITNIIDWNKNHFGNLFQKKNRVLARLKGI